MRSDGKGGGRGGDPSHSETVLDADSLRRNADIVGIPLPRAAPPKLIQAWIDHLRLLYRWNTKINLTAIRDPREGLRRHLLESLAALPHLDSPHDEPFEGTLIDIGSGNGYPGVPLMIASTASRGLLVEAAQRKVDFLRSVCRSCQLSERVEVLHERAPDVDTLLARIAEAERPARLLFRGIPEPMRWLEGAASESTVDRCIAWLSSSDAEEGARRLRASSREATVEPLPTHESGALLVIR